MSGGSVLIKARDSKGDVKELRLDENQSLKIVMVDEDGEILGDSTSLKVILTDELGNTLGGTDAVKVVLCGTQSEGTVTPLLCDANGKLITTTGV